MKIKYLASYSVLPHIAFVVMALLNTGCPSEVTPAGECDEGCATDQVCVNGTCEDLRAGSCVVDSDCDSRSDEVCMNGLCRPRGGNLTGMQCSNTGDCPLDQWCDPTESPATCQLLTDSLCRNDSHCSGDAGICLASNAAAPGRCVECTDDDDCDGTACISPGVCFNDSEDPCGPNSSETTPGVCVCDDGYVGNGAGECVLAMDDDDDDDPVVVPAGWTCPADAYGDGLCDCGCSVRDEDCPTFSGSDCVTELCPPGEEVDPLNNTLCKLIPGGGDDVVNDDDNDDVVVDDNDDVVVDDSDDVVVDDSDDVVVDDNDDMVLDDNDDMVVDDSDDVVVDDNDDVVADDNDDVVVDDNDDMVADDNDDVVVDDTDDTGDDDDMSFDLTCSGRCGLIGASDGSSCSCDPACSVAGDCCDDFEAICPEQIAGCNNSCNFSNDGECDDGGPGSDYNVCDLGSDCSDCQQVRVLENISCVSQGQLLECDEAGLECVSLTSNDVPVEGACKRICQTAADCSAGETCMEGFLSGGDGICGIAKDQGQSCGYWLFGENVCERSAGGVNDSTPWCINGTCELLCDWSTKADAPLTCPAQTPTCPVDYTPADIFPGVDVAVCQ